MTGASKIWLPERKIRYYATHVRLISDDHNWETDTIEALIARSALAERWTELTGEQRAAVLDIDEKLLQVRERVAEMLPAKGEPPPRSEWWWYLNEGLRVREEAERAV